MQVIEFLLQTDLAPSPRFEETFFPLGFPLVVSSNAQCVLDAARAEWNTWSPVFDEPPILLNFDVSPTIAALPEASEFHALGHQFAFAAGAKNLAIGDTSSRSGVAWLTANAVEDAPYFRYHFLEAMALEMIVSLYLTPFHAGLVEREGRGVLLCGDGGMGKSSIALGCARRGWTYLSDDACYLLRERAPERIVLGHPHRVRLKPDAPRLFPELASRQPARRGNGKLYLELRTDTIEGIATAPRTAVDRIVVLQRRAQGSARLERVHDSVARQICEPIFYWWDERISSEQQAAFNTLLASSQVFTLEYAELDSAIDLLES
jgi:hypothetical protein